MCVVMLQFLLWMMFGVKDALPSALETIGHRDGVLKALNFSSKALTVMTLHCTVHAAKQWLQIQANSRLSWKVVSWIYRVF